MSYHQQRLVMFPPQGGKRAKRPWAKGNHLFPILPQVLKQCPRPPDLPDAEGKLLPPSRNQQLADEAVLNDARKETDVCCKPLRAFGLQSTKAQVRADKLRADALQRQCFAVARTRLRWPSEMPSPRSSSKVASQRRRLALILGPNAERFEVLGVRILWPQHRFGAFPFKAKQVGYSKQTSHAHTHTHTSI